MFTLPPLPYSYDALSPAIRKDIMELHYSKHHQAYVDKLNAALGNKPAFQGRSLEDLLTKLDAVPESLRTAVRNHGGGHYNHSLFWQCMTPNAVSAPGGAFGEALIAKYGTFDEFTSQFNSAAKSLFGSGWVWLTRDLEIVALPNQDSPLSSGKGAPLMGLDVWEHAYYLDYKNRRDEYIENWWQVVNWPFIEARYAEQQMCSIIQNNR